ncbi:MAG: hypothetical protein PHI23_05075 [Candidatus Peribacteraceae bacterium]|nr:hypothetical protein [Candidatus Peribacteraceae bacterium]
MTAAVRVDVKTTLFGFKYDFLPLAAFLVVRRAPWSAAFQSLLGRVLLVIGCVVAAYGVVSFLLPQKFFFWLGYSPVHSLYFADTPLAAFQQIGDTSLRRIQSTMSGPNQLGLWLLLPWNIALVRFLKERKALFLLPLGIIGLALLLSFSRSAFIGAFLATLIALRIGLPPRVAKRAFLSFLGVTLVAGIVLVLLFPKVFWRLGSTRGHLTRPILAMQEVLKSPLGKGMGMAGPASTHLRDTCVFLRAQDDPAWAKNIPDLCVFVGGVKVQPADRECVCPNLPENWYVQMGVEAGIVGFALFLALTMVMLTALARSRQPLSPPVFLSFLGIAVAALFLHAWEDSAVAYSLWVLSGLSLSVSQSYLRR